MGKTSEELRAMGFTPRIIVFTLLLAFVWVFVFYASSVRTMNLHPGLTPIFVLSIEAALIKWLGPKYQFTKQEWTVFFIMGFSGLFANTYYGGIWGGSEGGLMGSWVMGFQRAIYAMARAYAIEDIPGGFPDLWLPKDITVLDDLRLGGVPVPWGAWIPTIAIFGGATVLLMLINYFLILVWRKPWIEYEKVTYPQLVPTYNLLISAKEGEAEGRTPFFNPIKNKVFWVPFFLGVLVTVPEVLSQTMGMRLPGEIEPGAYGIILEPYLGEAFPEWTGEWGSLWFAISWTGWCGAMLPIWFFCPMDLLKSTIVVMIVFYYLLPMIIVRSGLGTPGMWFEGGEGTGVPYALLLGFGGWMPLTGPLFGVAAWLFFHYRKHIWHTIKSAIAGSPRDPTEPHSWRFVWVGLVLCLVVWWALMIGSGAGVYSIVNIVPWLLIYLVMNRVWAESGRSMGCCGFDEWSAGLLHMDFLRVTGYDVSAPNTALNANWFLFQNFRYGGLSHSGGHEIGPLASFKVANVTETSSRSIGWAYILAIVAGVFMFLPLAIWMSYTHGWSAIFGRVGEMGGIVEGNSLLAQEMIIGASTAELQEIPNYYPWCAVGAILTFVLFFLRARFAWFWFTPIAFLVHDGCMRMLFLGIIFFTVLKWLILRIGGARAYEKIGVPAVMGFWIGIIAFGEILRIIIAATGAAEFMFA